MKMYVNIKSTSFWLAVIGLLLALSLGAFFYFAAADSTTAVIYQGSEEIYRINLPEVKEEYEFDISSELGSNTVTVGPGYIGITKADCPDKLCVQQGFIKTGAVPVVCLPHKIYISIEDEN